MKIRIASIGLVVLVFGSGLARGIDDTVLLAGRSDSVLFDPTMNIQPGGIQQFSFFYSDPSSNIQGFTIVACFDGPLVALPGTFTIEGSILDAVDAEYLSMQVDNDDNDGDGREIIIGVLIDALPPFNGQTAPPTFFPQEIGRFDFYAPEDINCSQCYPITFCNDVNGNGSVYLTNKVVINNQSIEPAGYYDGEVCAPANALFIRGDSNNDGIFDVADAVFMLNYLFLDSVEPPCPDAADADNDGLLNITDPVFMVLYIFGLGVAPPYPFPSCGLETYPDVDFLDCLVLSPACPVCP